MILNCLTRRFPLLPRRRSNIFFSVIKNSTGFHRDIMTTTASSSSSPSEAAATVGEKRKHDSVIEKNSNKQKTVISASTITITEGSAVMIFPSNQESTVFYNPVQVQNRDLSILMITLYAERRSIRTAVKKRRKELNKRLQKKGITNEELQNQLKLYEESLYAAAASAASDDCDRSNGDGDGDGDGGRQLLIPNPNLNSRIDNSNIDNTSNNGISILDALAASGLRSIRYWKEISGVKHITINDLEEAAVERAKDNLRNNELDGIMLPDNIERPYGICVNHGDATHEMYLSRRSQSLFHTPKTALVMKQFRKQYDVIDLDPYGSAAPFLDGAVQAVESGGLLCITCTDMAALGGSHPETAYGRYASLPIQSAKYLQELALRILLHTIAVSASKYGRTIRPVLSVGMDFYVRVFVEVHIDKKGVNDLSLMIGNVYQSTQCSSFVTIPHGQKGGKNNNGYQSTRLNPSVCPETGAPFKIGGPLWLGPLHDQKVVASALDRLGDEKCQSPKMSQIATRTRLEGLLTSVSEELDTPLFYTIPGLCQGLKCTSPPIRSFKAAVINAGYKVSGYHKEPHAVKTDAPGYIVWDIMRAWVEKNPHQKKPAEDSTASKILSIERTIMDVDFTTITKISVGNNNNTRKVSRFPQNPQKNWGPKRAATGMVLKENNTRNGDGSEP